MKYALILLAIVAVAGVAATAAPADLHEQRYFLPYSQAEHLSLILRLNLPRNTTVRTEAAGMEVALIIKGPVAVHKGVAPFIALLQDEQTAQREEAKAQRHERMKVKPGDKPPVAPAANPEA